MKTVGISPADAEDSLVTISQHVPVGVDIGRPLLVHRAGDDLVVIVADAGAGQLGWQVRRDEVEQMLTQGDETVILTWFHGRVALDRLDDELSG